LKEISLPKSLKELGKGAFLWCNALESVSGIEGVDWQKKQCFVGTPWMAEHVGSGFFVTENYLEAYTGDEATIEIPEGTKVIGRYAFLGNSNITTVVIPEGATKIEGSAFWNCRNLRFVQIPDSVTEIAGDAFGHCPNLVIRCTRGSAASAFRRELQIPCEYIAKTKTAPAEPERKRAKSARNDGLSGLSEEELRLIMELRRNKIAQKKEEAEKAAIPEKTEYALASADSSKIGLSIADDSRKITNNIFNLKFTQTAANDGSKAVAEYEAFVIDAFGRIISDIKPIRADKSGEDLTHKVAFTLSAQEKFDKAAEYFVAVRYKGEETTLLSKTQYQINIAFAADFGF
jgi:hypothetical protein